MIKSLQINFLESYPHCEMERALLQQLTKELAYIENKPKTLKLTEL